MSIKLTWYGHACFPGNPLAPVNAEEVEADFILVSHGHGDHLGDTLEIAKRTGATVVSNFEIKNWLEAQGLVNLHPQHIGGAFGFPWGRVKLTIAHHGSSLPDGSYGGNPAGFLITIGEKKIYHACDTGLFYDMKLIGEEGIDLAILPIGDNFTMGPEDALRATKLIGPKQVLPIHYDTFDIIKQDPRAFAKRVEQETSAKPVVISPGDSIEL
jgi:L-ascorbate metabolism protein UlaG (beta-lactamase superfamily)